MESGLNNGSIAYPKRLIFLTGCINPDGMAQTKLQNPSLRREQYINSIKFYLDNYNLPILFVENSNSDILEFLPVDIDHRRIELLTFDGNNFDKSLGKGYGEMGIIDHAIRHSHFFNNSDFIFKITGRHQVLNFASVLKQAEKRVSVDIIVDMWNMFSYADSRCWGASRRFIEEVFIHFWKDVDDSRGYNFEDALAKSIYKGLQLDYKLELMKNTPRFKGSSGTENKGFDHSWTSWFPRNAIHVLKYILNRR